MVHFGNSYPIVTRGSRVSRVPPHHAFPAFLDPNDIKSLNFAITSKKLLETWSNTSTTE